MTIQYKRVEPKNFEYSYQSGVEESLLPSRDIAVPTRIEQRGDNDSNVYPLTPHLL
jgi:hypothetical protein